MILWIFANPVTEFKSLAILDVSQENKEGTQLALSGIFRFLIYNNKVEKKLTFKIIFLIDRTILIANNITQLSKDTTLTISGDDVTMCKNMVKNRSRRNIFELLSKSLAPSIYGHDYVKKAILCLMLGGNEKILPNGTRLRG